MLGNTAAGLVYSPSTSRRLLISLTICIRLELSRYKKSQKLSSTMDLRRKSRQKKNLPEAPEAQLGGNQRSSKEKGREDVERTDEEPKSTPSPPVNQPFLNPSSKRARKSYTASTGWPRSALSVH